jgi:hypothetical protein
MRSFLNLLLEPVERLFFKSAGLRRAAVLLVGAQAFVMLLTPSQAGLPLPDHIVYGTITISNQPVTSANTDVTVEARFSSNGPLVASYAMGSAARLGTYYYELRFQLEDASPSSPQVIVLGQQLLLTVQNSAGVQFELPYQVPDQGGVTRLDFGTNVDANGSGVPDRWELANFGTNNVDLSRDSDGDGVPDWAEYIAGTNPKDATDLFRLEMVPGTNQVQVSFHALAAAGIGYEGVQRFYALESSTNLLTGNWNALPDLSRVSGNDQMVVYCQPTGGTNVPAFFRARVWLEGPH